MRRVDLDRLLAWVSHVRERLSTPTRRIAGPWPGTV